MLGWARIEPGPAGSAGFSRMPSASVIYFHLLVKFWYCRHR